MKKVMLFGTFDILHLGHLDLFRQAKEFGDYLMVVIARDERVEQLKGRAPIHSAEERKIMLDALSIVDKAIIGGKDDVYAVIKKEKPDVITLGYDQMAFVDKLVEKLRLFELETELFRLEPYKVEKHKSGKVREYIESEL